MYFCYKKNHHNILQTHFGNSEENYDGTVSVCFKDGIFYICLSVTANSIAFQSYN